MAVITVENLGKKYTIGHQKGTRYQTLRDTLAHSGRGIMQRLRHPLSPNRELVDLEEIWALRDVNFEIKQGERVGIIGRNGAGKSTLLKILSRITHPTTGRVTLNGRVASLLEVGTGFHPELTGRENIYLNGAILGMTRQEITRKFDEIVAFAEVEKFLDTPVKHYSSGMYVRLAFAVAAHLEPEILLVDEVLAVGDAQFQKKCLGKMEDVSKEGRTVLFVSHQMNAIRRLCDRCLWIEHGQLKLTEKTVHVLSVYESALAGHSTQNDITRTDLSIPAQFLEWAIIEPKAEKTNFLSTFESITFKMIIQVNKPILDGTHGIALWNSDHQLIWAWAAYNMNIQPGKWAFTYTLPYLPLRPGVYSWHVSMQNEGILLDQWHCSPPLIINTMPLTHKSDEWSGILNIPCLFSLVGEQYERKIMGF